MDGHDHVSVGDRLEDLVLEPLGPQKRALLLTGRAERAPSTGVGDQVARPAGRAPGPGHGLVRQAPPEAVPALEPLLPRPLHSLVEGVEKTPKRRLPGIPRPVDATGALHVPPEAGSGRDAGGSRRRTIRRSGDKTGSGGCPRRSGKVTAGWRPRDGRGVLAEGSRPSPQEELIRGVFRN